MVDFLIIVLNHPKVHSDTIRSVVASHGNMYLIRQVATFRSSYVRLKVVRN